ncbi:Probable ABC transporter ATP-binding protein HI_0664 [Delftia tsuruhatensis]|uniref:amino acid ABC transporter ATP-binding/permease protein n=1 Tax=Delftia tsuruhatensis TaxID=180282 RepID=UPI001E7B2FB5|nr:ATP-binding cassette domain-containing protein [Delftia tsuruhatensis]CAB5713794.1 Probable ABC transporter ATP-binding protein HI_0664 [Delftia tsuruhatensis]CAC9688752.1 Probable ABC transporter ATP-binding protein HI_0664 [Delftia tsuruhatensis]
MKPRSRLLPVLAALAGLAPRRLWLGGALLALLTVLMGMALLGLSGWFITATALAGLVPATALVFDVFMPSAGIRLLALGRTGTRYAERLATHDATLAVLAALRERLLRSWAVPAAALSLRLRPARLLQRLTADVDALDSLYLRLFVPLLAAVGATLVAALVLGLMQWWLGLALGLWLLATGLGSAIWLARRARRPALRRALALESLRARTADLVAGQAELAMAGTLAAHCERIAVLDARVAEADGALHGLEARASLVQGLSAALALAGVLLGAGWLAEAGRLGAPVAALALLLALTAMEPFAALRRGALEAGRSWLAARRLAPALRSPGDAGQAMPAAPHPGLAVELEQAVAPRGAGLPQQLRIQEGERVALLGASGAGKSTLLSLMAGELEPLAGQVRAQRCTWMTQRTELFEDSLRDNLRLACPDAPDERLWQALEIAGLAGDVRAMDRGLDTPLGEGGLGLSGGQARRLALARLLLNPARCWLLDEPTEGLDAATAHDLLARLDGAMQGRTVVLATHKRREARLADRLLWVGDGVVVSEARRGTLAFEAALERLRQDGVDTAG